MSTPSPRRLVLGIIALTLALLVAPGSVPGRATAAAPSAASSAAPSPHRSAGAAQMASPVAGVTTWRHFFTLHGLPERSFLMRVDLSARSGLYLNAASPDESIGAPRRTVPAMADLTGAVGGINGDWFDLMSWSAVPRGALIRNGKLLKTPRPQWTANLYVRRDRTVAIGPIPFRGRVSALDAAGNRVASANVLSVNTPYDAAHGHIVYLTHDLVRLGIRRACTVAFGRTEASGQVITRVVTGDRDVPRIVSGRWALAACGGSGADWLWRNLRPHGQPVPVSVSLSFPAGRPVTAVSGGRVLVRNGRAYTDVGGQRLSGLNPETFACVSKSGRSLLLGVIDGRSALSAGVTQPQLQKYLLALHCWAGMDFDGGGSSTLVSRVGSAPGVSVLNVPSDGTPRAVADGLFVYKR
jgi:hypothetical protein